MLIWATSTSWTDHLKIACYALAMVEITLWWLSQGCVLFELLHWKPQILDFSEFSPSQVPIDRFVNWTFVDAPPLIRDDRPISSKHNETRQCTKREHFQFFSSNMIQQVTYLNFQIYYRTACHGILEWLSCRKASITQLLLGNKIWQNKHSKDCLLYESILLVK